MSLLLAAGLAGSLGASDIAERYKSLNHQMMCTCGCAQILGECNHLGCPRSTPMLATLQTDLTSGMDDHAILVDFSEKYGPTALASPLLTRFNKSAWIMPPAVLILAMLGALLVLRQWREHGRAQATANGAGTRPPLTPRESEALARIRRETGGEL
ncbi:cytochrome c-type biogenesis protein CcmH [Acidipila sp. EB88]|uniref:cytochrome c-type biogenesis protein CcmH n=1 Tax=Acidipila sp. EB88 TaxID=2305226 RepID=UPI0013156F8B|nr:cytochrome c-type biogenesis protein CcmH [Acidipila sp. EB88]